VTHYDVSAAVSERKTNKQQMAALVKVGVLNSAGLLLLK
jgi:hypothetical protein